MIAELHYWARDRNATGCNIYMVAQPADLSPASTGAPLARALCVLREDVVTNRKPRHVCE